MVRKCSAKTSAGKKCGNIAQSGSDFCRWHNPNNPKKKRVGPRSKTVNRIINNIETLRDLIAEAKALYADLINDAITHRQAAAAAKVMQIMAYCFDLLHKHEKTTNTGEILNTEEVRAKIREIYGMGIDDDNTTATKIN
jgi:hypothetical protein